MAAHHEQSICGHILHVWFVKFLQNFEKFLKIFKKFLKNF
tara:strand:+ start:264 stop:383 length:120 start_codon:yes stop_codon:yes gene_type:complete